MRKKIINLLYIVALLVIALTFVACEVTEQEQTNIGSYIIQGEKNLIFKAGEISDDQLLEGVTVKSSDGTTYKPTVDRGGKDYSVAGKYELKYSYENVSKTVYVYVYGEMQIYNDGEKVNSEEIEIGYYRALTSSNFTGNIAIKDSFGEEVEFEVQEGSDTFKNREGEYSVTYKAEDKAGQSFLRTLTYNVVNDTDVSVGETTVEYKDGKASVNVGYNGINDCWLEDEKGLIPGNLYEVKSDRIEIDSKYYRELTSGAKTIYVCSYYGANGFTLNIVDDGNPIFNLDDLANSSILTSEANALPKPKKEVLQHNYTYAYELTKSGETYTVTEQDNSLYVSDKTGKNLSAGYYDLSVTATNTENTLKKTTKTLKFRIYNSEKELNFPSFITAAASFSQTDLAEYPYATSYNYMGKAGSDSWNNRLQFNLAESGYGIFSCDICIYESTASTSGNCGFPFIAGSKKPATTLPITYVNKATGESVGANELNLNTWYTVYVVLSGLDFGDEEIPIYLYFGTDGKSSCKAYLSDFKLYDESAVESCGEIASQINIANTSAGYFGIKLVDGEFVRDYVKTDAGKDSADKARLVIPHIEAKELIMDIYIESSSSASGGKANLDFVNIEYKQNAPHLPTVLYDKESGQKVKIADIETGKWYFLVMDITGTEKDLAMYPTLKESVKFEILIKNIKTNNSGTKYLGDGDYGAQDTFR